MNDNYSPTPVGVTAILPFLTTIATINATTTVSSCIYVQSCFDLCK